MTRLVVIGDLHGDAMIAGRDYHHDVMAKLQSVEVQETDIIVQLGDVADPDNGARTCRALDALAGWYASHENHVVQLVGNHDRFDDMRATSYLRLLEYIPNVSVVDRISAWRIAATQGGSTTWALAIPWLSRAHGEFDILAEGMAKLDYLEDGDRAVIFCHQDIEGAMPGSEADLPRLGRQVLPMEIVDDPRVLKVFAGHLHGPQTLHGGRVEVVGSLECLGMGERDHKDKGWLEVTL